MPRPYIIVIQKIFIKSHSQIMCGSNFYESDVNRIKMNLALFMGIQKQASVPNMVQIIELVQDSLYASKSKNLVQVYTLITYVYLILPFIYFKCQVK